ncbi:MAG TPA: 3-hydroxyacyl-CoA dehydrogenase NAD-binding domain-containing protein [Casimicrobiaceae bacterium]|nr:3-hydroxyacyl-CoA dehydrogenase NAD-binding domain-containing protein [Casimicrobiaceae bacterium]
MDKTPVASAIDGRVAVITIDSPPVNALGQAVRAGIVDTLARTRVADVDAVVLASTGRLFSAGADITEFGKPPLAPSLREVIAALDAFPKPVVAAVQGAALGGGFELALGCHFRIASAAAQFGLPEIKLGLLPGAGGTQRLPRIVGPVRAVEMIVSGKPVDAAKAKALGIADELADGPLLQHAIAFARSVVSSRSPLRPVSQRDEKLAPLRVDPAAFDEAATRLTANDRQLRAPAACVAAVRASFELPFAEGLVRERALFDELMQGEQSRALRYVFRAERKVATIPGMPADTAAAPIAEAAVIGAGTMGSGIAMCFANAGIPVVLLDATDEALDRGLDAAARNYATSVKRGSLTAEAAAQALSRITRSLAYDALADADIVVEAVFEEMAIKQEVMRRIDAAAKPGAIIATNTSTLDVDAIAGATRRPQYVIGTHFFSPANVMRLLEAVRGAKTSWAVIATTLALAKKIGKVAVLSGNCDGFIGNRMLARRITEAQRLLQEGALPHEVDAALTDFGMAMGHFAVDDLAGLDVSMRIRRRRGTVEPIADRLCELGRFGQKSGKGYYRYEAGSRMPIRDPEVERIIVETSAQLGIERRAISAAEIVERIVYPTVNEGARILAEGIALRPEDIDIVWINGYGWPGWRGGPMYYADEVGLPIVRDRLSELAKRSGDSSLEPAPLLVERAAARRGFIAQ